MIFSINLVDLFAVITFQQLTSNNVNVRFGASFFELTRPAEHHNAIQSVFMNSSKSVVRI